MSSDATDYPAPSTGPPYRLADLLFSRNGVRVAAAGLLALHFVNWFVLGFYLGIDHATIVMVAMFFLVSTFHRSVLWPIFGLTILALQIVVVYQVAELSIALSKVGEIYEGTGVTEMEEWIPDRSILDIVISGRGQAIAFLSLFWVYFAIASFRIWRGRGRVAAERAAEPHARE